MKTYTIKPLEWEEFGYTWAADTIFGRFCVREFQSPTRYYWYWPPQRSEWKDYDTCDSIEDGKAKAEEWFRERLLGALEEVQ